MTELHLSPAVTPAAVGGAVTSQPNLLTPNPVYKPFYYPWAYEAWLMQQRIHWLPEEVPLADDVKDWHKTLSEGERNLLTQIFRFFTQGDVEVNKCYMRHYSQVFQPTEVVMMLAAFSNMETIHVAAYSHLLDTIGMPETEYQAFMKYAEMREKYDYFQGFSVDDLPSLAKTMAAFGAFTEGLQLFASFAILLNFPRFNKMKGMGQIVTWSARDETLHCNSIIRLFRTFIEENPQVWTDAFQQELYDICDHMVVMEDAFIDLAFEMGAVEGLSGQDVKNYIRYIANRRLLQLGLQPLYQDQLDKNPLPWMDEMLNGVEHANFFENRATEYSKAATQGSWGDAFAELDSRHAAVG
ncbi:MAG: ribonucleotide-diphosphate reductase subunit beta [Rhodospirillaceae bacterium]|jgi:ribonucleoside-diphosphate reductase beta chain|nr:ribonucleotide-diphosphate reductase subunit beta [Rhodospirillaceae bacterium]